VCLLCSELSMPQVTPVYTVVLQWCHSVVTVVS
jgi:hypothetical protein